ncbi:Endonuclease, Uma2 family (restriction endonuclease fold) [Amycolatopsis arida]|uniref:Endonuclease, Uma2 family (Restriction endonuclease fold) n=1 Tax=Amycolatopsis arida TaxID=587909 RepID=A0A1I5T2A7_9PSEU|nr:Uma2 family endonuclease [Amycolatopsis arida]TDX96263.1 Uma2 family endonuclease [Amycolatopsis arida]SFP76981.1 Endonuclease, Uma2 family (restriction endonuclease fold) [Amycolatopsis arida]
MAMPLHRTGRLMTLDEFIALPEDNSYRYELQEGVLVVSPRAVRRHQRAVLRLSRQLHDQLPAGWECLPDMEVVVRAEDPAIVRVPDLVVTRVDGPEARLTAADVLLAVEVISPGSRNVDTRLKPFEYAEAGIPHYWLVDLDPPAPSITVFHSGAPDEGYVEEPALAGELVTSVPFSLRIDIPALVATRAEPGQ